MRKKGILIPCVFFLLQACCNGPMAPLAKELKSYGYTLYEPPRTNRGPGWTFRMVRTFDGRTVPMTVCENLYPDVDLVDGNLSLPQLSTKSTVDGSVAVDFLEGLLKDIGGAKASLSANSIKKLTISWGQVSSKELPEERKFTEKGEIRAIGAPCAAVLKELKDRGELAGNLFIVQQAILANELSYETSDDSGKKGELKASLKKLLNFEANAKATEITQTSLQIKEPRYIGYIAIALLEWAPTGLLGPESAKLYGRRLSPDELAKITQ